MNEEQVRKETLLLIYCVLNNVTSRNYEEAKKYLPGLRATLVELTR